MVVPWILVNFLPVNITIVSTVQCGVHDYMHVVHLNWTIRQFHSPTTLGYCSE